jgi:hypothetical protein
LALETPNLRSLLRDHEYKLDYVRWMCGEEVSLFNWRGRIRACALADTLHIEVRFFA